MAKTQINLRVWIDKDFCVQCADLPGCVSEGDSVGECLSNIREAFELAAETYFDHGETIPWKDGGEMPIGSSEHILQVSIDCLE